MNCPVCQAKVSNKHSLFKVGAFTCEECGSSLRTSITSRLLFILSLSLLAVYHTVVKGQGPQSEHLTLWFSLVVIAIPILATLKLPRYEQGEQSGPLSIASNTLFFAVVGLLLYLWALS